MSTSCQHHEGRTPPNVDQKKHCRYRNFSRTTMDCWALKNKIEELVQVGHLHRFVSSNHEEDKRPRVDERRIQDLEKREEHEMSENVRKDATVGRLDLYES